MGLNPLEEAGWWHADFEDRLIFGLGFGVVVVLFPNVDCRTFKTQICSNLFVAVTECNCKFQTNSKRFEF